MRAFGAPGDRIAFSAPTFSMIPTFARLNGLRSGVRSRSPRATTWMPSGWCTCGAKITYLCTPNNPTATALSREAVEYVVAHAHGVVLLDEAYAEFAPETFVDLVARSRATGRGAHLLEGVRAGRTARGLRRRRSRGRRDGGAGARPVQGERVGGARRARRARGVGRRARLGARRMRRSRWRIASGWRTACARWASRRCPSAANFVFVPTARAAHVARGLRERGVARPRVRRAAARISPRSRHPSGAALRIGVGPWADDADACSTRSRRPRS